MAPTLPVSVIIPAYDRAGMIERAIASVWAQRPALPAEVIVVDDASSDATAAVAERLGARVIVHETNRGAATARNTGVAAARSAWVAMLDSDDAWLPHHLDTLWPLRDGHDLAAGAAIAVGDDDAPPRYHGPLARRPVVLRSPAPLYPENFIPASAVLVRRAAVLDAGGYRTDLRNAEDLDLWIRVIERGSAIVTPRVVLRYGRHGGQKSQLGTGSRTAQRQIVEAYRDRDWWEPRLLQLQLAFRAWDAMRAALRHGDRSAALVEARWLLGRPGRLRALATLLLRRWRSRRRSARLSPSGEPSVAILPGVDVTGVDAATADLRRRGGTVRAVLALARRPTGVAIVRSRRQALAVRSVGVSTRLRTSPDVVPSVDRDGPRR